MTMCCRRSINGVRRWHLALTGSDVAVVEDGLTLRAHVHRGRGGGGGVVHESPRITGSHGDNPDGDEAEVRGLRREGSAHRDRGISVHRERKQRAKGGQEWVFTALDCYT